MSSPGSPKHAFPELHIRPFEEEDLLELSDIEAMCFEEDAYDKQLLTEITQKPNCVTLIAEAAPGIVGYAALEFREATCEIISIAITPDSRGKGYGRRLLECCLDAARKRNAARVLLTVRESNVEAIRLYRLYGFTRRGRLDEYYPDDETGIRMGRAL
jgi:ribosomal-protein-alanine N-acetyltransferase